MHSTPSSFWSDGHTEHLAKQKLMLYDCVMDSTVDLNYICKIGIDVCTPTCVYIFVYVNVWKQISAIKLYMKIN